MSVREPYVDPPVTGPGPSVPDAPASESGADDPVLVPGSRLNLLASAVRNGTYRVDPFDVADSMLPYVRVFA